MADVLVDNATNSYLHYVANNGGGYWTSPTTCYVIFIDSGNDLNYAKTIDGGSTWNTTELVSGTFAAMDSYADWQTNGDTGTIIHIIGIDRNTNTIEYIYLDTSGDTTGTDTIEACQGSGVISGSTARSLHYCNISKTRGGNIIVIFHYRDDLNVDFYGCYTSSDGDTWTSKATPWEGITGDYTLLFPGNEADNQDAWCIFWDATANEISLKTYDDSLDSWSEQLISGSMVETINYQQMAGATMHSNDHLLFVAWNLYDNANADLKCWDINGAGSITAKTDVLTDSAESFLCAVFIDQSTDRIYVAYMRGTAVQSEVSVYYKYSDDGGSTWNSEQSMSEDAEEDLRWVSVGAVAAANGGKYMPVWFDDDDNDLFCNTDNAVSIAASGGGWSNISKINGVTATNLAKVDGIAVASIAKICGVAV